MAISAFPEENEASTPLTRELQKAIIANGPMPFREFMQTALYDPDHGYYIGEKQRVGKDGDFITSVSVGKCFGLILAHRLERHWQELGKPDTFQIIEPGAHDGALCLDILTELRDTFPDFYQAVTYHLVETTEQQRFAQETKLTPDHSGKFKTHCDLSEICGAIGAIISNELIDAFPVDLIQQKDGQWHTLMVDLDEKQRFKLSPAPLPEGQVELCNFCDTLKNHPEGYTTEFQPSLRSFTDTASEVLERGLLITIDYGHHTEDYYHPDRITGTLQTFHRHQKSDNPLSYPGEIDITAHVDFTRLQAEAEKSGFQLNSLSNQASYLTHQAKNWLLAMEQAPTSESVALFRQFQTLTHPAMLGSRFMVLEMQK